VTTSSDPARFGFVTSKKLGGAVIRNRVKRRLRALAAQTLRSYPQGYDIVVRAHSDASRATYEELSVAWSEMESQLVG
jgi:ribonuclease P protein component